MQWYNFVEDWPVQMWPKGQGYDSKWEIPLVRVRFGSSACWEYAGIPAVGSVNLLLCLYQCYLTRASVFAEDRIQFGVPQKVGHKKVKTLILHLSTKNTACKSISIHLESVQPPMLSSFASISMVATA